MKAYSSFLKCRLNLIGDIYFEGDIVEVLNGLMLVGSRHRVKCHVSNQMIKRPTTSSYEEFSRLHSDPLNNNVCILVTLDDFSPLGQNEIMLYKRPFKNWVKFVLSKIIGVYIP